MFWQTKLKAPITTWHKWYAWRPLCFVLTYKWPTDDYTLYKDQWHWFEYLERRWVDVYDGFWEYRIPGTSITKEGYKPDVGYDDLNWR